MNYSLDEFATVHSVGPTLIEIEIHDPTEYEAKNIDLRVGSYITITDSLNEGMLTVIEGFRLKEIANVTQPDDLRNPRFIISLRPIGRLHDGSFRRGGNQITIPPKKISIAEPSILTSIYNISSDRSKLSFGALEQNNAIRVVLDGDKFFGKHIGVVGSTGSGKSTTVAAILQNATKRTPEQGNAGILNNSHILIFDLHNEYHTAFPGGRTLGVNELSIPYWLMNSEELENLFIESNEQNSHNQTSQFRHAVTQNKLMHNTEISPNRISYDSPIYFSLLEVRNYLDNLNREVIGKKAGEDRPKLSSGALVDSREAQYFSGPLDFVEPSQKTDEKASRGAFAVSLIDLSCA